MQAVLLYILLMLNKITEDIKDGQKESMGAFDKIQ